MRWLARVAGLAVQVGWLWQAGSFSSARSVAVTFLFARSVRIHANHGCTQPFGLGLLLFEIRDLRRLEVTWFVAGDLLTRSLLVASRLSSFEQERPFSALTDTADDSVLFRLLATSAYNAMQQGFATLSQRLAVGAAAWASWLSAPLVRASCLGWLCWL